MLVTPVVMPELPKLPKPAVSDCNTLISHADELIRQMQTAQANLEAVSSAPDETVQLMRQKLADMITKAKSMRSELDVIRSNAVQQMDSFSF